MTETIVLSKAIAAGAMVGSTTGTFYCGYTLREGASADAIIYIRDTSATGVILDIIGFAADENVSDYYGDAPLWSNGPLFVEVVAGTLPAGSIRYR